MMISNDELAQLARMLQQSQAGHGGSVSGHYTSQGSSSGAGSSLLSTAAGQQAGTFGADPSAALMDPHSFYGFLPGQASAGTAAVPVGYPGGAGDPSAMLLMSETPGGILQQSLAGLNFPDFSLLIPAIDSDSDSQSHGESGRQSPMSDVPDILGHSSGTPENKKSRHHDSGSLSLSSATNNSSFSAPIGVLDLGTASDSADATIPGGKRVGSAGVGSGGSSASKAEAIRMRNREHARKSRMRKRMYMEQLQSAVEKLTEEQTRYEQLLKKREEAVEKVKAMEQRNRELEEQNRKLSQLVSKVSLSDGPDAVSATGPATVMTTDHTNKANVVDVGQANGEDGQDEMTAHIKTAIMFMDHLSARTPWSEVRALVVDDASFNCATLVPLNTVEGFVQALIDMHRTYLSHFYYENVSVATDGNKVTVASYMHGRHDVPYGPHPPANPPKSFRTLSVYTFHMDEQHRIAHIDKVMDLYSIIKQLEWPMPEDVSKFIISLTIPVNRPPDEDMMTE